LAIRTEHLTKIYAQRLIAVNNMNLQVPRDSVFGLLGPILKLIDASNLSLQAIDSGSNATENAYLQLLQEDEAHGFQR
jgi:hypothetical protein